MPMAGNNPTQAVFGAQYDAAYDILGRLYDPLVEETGAPAVETGIREAEMIKYANNAVLASKALIINDIGNI